MLSLAEIATAPVEELVERASAEPILDSSDLELLAGRVGTDARARVALALSFLRLGIDEAIRNRGLGVPQERLVRIASTAVIEAAEAFDPERDGSFEGYARTRVRRALGRAIAS